ncbi:hypothetical protein LTR10_015632 [Elasticomyces elasticus]|uniref:Uncharacterized protein n=1 Tax=Exophiala sideris TaxID=1016849 RepID=A0ABR0JL61_9EURO|nr:hypothetical protein LTR10_015632 [Elasticomyces elasticus]KAK5036341.1 hypothetical protein LTS07_002068 [Exophiala sideris]KAK5041827.1 hypothetical protein LTR13_002494 [Exophiala sideris]KAK5066725.1 hypothetical protein LTR69_002072 [Exophiala sideris]KAK5184783.1 hypothetical protein LTR44_002629 [Eurotiomycetes sp. CCFEE 6388]
MSVCAFSVQHDAEVQAYNELRRAYLAEEKERKRQEKARKSEDKILREAFSKDRRVKMQAESYNKSILSSVFRKKEMQVDRRLLIDGVEEKVMDEDIDVEEMSLKDALKC